MPDPLMIEGSVHHLDILADMGGAKCDTLYAQTWNPKWGEFAGDSQALVTMHLENGVRAFYEGAKTNAALLNGWSHEYIRAETEKSTLILDNRELTAHTIKPSGEIRPEPITSTIDLREQKYWRDTWITKQFCDWLDGGNPPPTNVEDNLQSIALIFAAIESSRSGQPAKVQELLQRAKKKAKEALGT
jgi:predicted dehydrogenase